MNKISAKELLNKLNSLKDSEYFREMQRINVMSELKVIGVRVPELKKLSNEYFNKSIKVEFNKETDKCFEAVLLEGFLISLDVDKVSVKEKLNAYYKKIDNWAASDMVCASLDAFKQGGDEEDFKYFSNLLNNENPWVVRFGIVALIKFFMNETFVEKVLEEAYKVKTEHYYVNMALAWLVSEVMALTPSKSDKVVKKIIKTNNFSRFIINHGIQKCIDSKRFTDKKKIKLKELKIKR